MLTQLWDCPWGVRREVSMDEGRPTPTVDDTISWAAVLDWIKAERELSTSGCHSAPWLWALCDQLPHAFHHDLPPRFVGLNLTHTVSQNNPFLPSTVFVRHFMTAMRKVNYYTGGNSNTFWDFITFAYLWVGVRTCVSMHLHRSEDDFWEWVFSFHMWVPGNEHRSSGLAASVFTHGSTLLAPFGHLNLA